MAGLCIGKDHEIAVETYCYRGNPYSMYIEDLESRFDIDRFGKVVFDVVPAFLERGIPDENLVGECFYAAHDGATSSMIFFKGRGLCTAFAVIFVQGKVIWAAISSQCSPYITGYIFAFEIAAMVAA